MMLVSSVEKIAVLFLGVTFVGWFCSKEFKTHPEKLIAKTKWTRLLECSSRMITEINENTPIKHGIHLFFLTNCQQISLVKILCPS